MQYDALAPMYDRLMVHVEYDEWLELVRRVIGRYCDADAPRILELGAGTGVVGSVLCGMGYDYSASDISFPMCKEAVRKCGLSACVCDARRIPFKSKFDMILFLYDGINYLFTREDYRELFASVYGVLAPGGLFLFDITTRANSMKHFSNYFDYDDYGDFSYVRHSYFDELKSIQRNDFTIYRAVGDESGHYEKCTEEHRQKVYSVSEIEKMIPRRRFDVVGIWDGYSFRKHSNKSLRVHFLLRKI